MISNSHLLKQRKQEEMCNINTSQHWKWTGHVLRQDLNKITRIALPWAPEGRMKRGHQETTWCKPVEETLLNNSIEKLAKDKLGLRNYVAAHVPLAWRGRGEGESHNFLAGGVLLGL